MKLRSARPTETSSHIPIRVGPCYCLRLPLRCRRRVSSCPIRVTFWRKVGKARGTNALILRFIGIEDQTTMPTIGVLALQGAFIDHVKSLRAANRPNLSVREVRTIEDLSHCDGIILPGGESTTMRILANQGGDAAPTLMKALRDFVHVHRKPIWGTCAGCILLADKPGDEGSAQDYGGAIHGMPVAVERNWYGRQDSSFEAPLIPYGRLSSFVKDLTAICIRAPAITEVLDPEVEILAEVNSPIGGKHVAAVAFKNILITIFHPELTDSADMHLFFLESYVEPYIRSQADTFSKEQRLTAEAVIPITASIQAA